MFRLCKIFISAPKHNPISARVCMYKVSVHAAGFLCSQHKKTRAPLWDNSLYTYIPVQQWVVSSSNVVDKL
jgi:hypothetical protein